MWSYKEAFPGPGCVVDLTMMLLVVLQWHRRCAETRVGLPWQTWAVVPSSRRTRVGEHPLVRLGMDAGLGVESTRLALDRAQLAAVGQPGADRDVRADRFAVLNPEVVAGRHVLLIEDSWVTGATLQSAAVTLKQAGAAMVTVLCLARWLREDGPADAAGYFGELPAFYDALSCPIFGGTLCSGPFGSAS